MHSQLVSILFTNLKVGPSREGAVRDVNRGAIFEEKMLHSAEKDVGPEHRHYCSCESGQPCRLTPSLVVLLHPALPEKCKNKTFFRIVQTHDLDLHVICTCVCSAHQGKVCLDDVTKGVGGVNPQTTLSIFQTYKS